MKIAAAQIKSISGEIARNVTRHCEVVQAAAEQGVGMIAFPELSLTGYEPSLAGRLAVDEEDPSLKPLQDTSDRHQIVIAAGIPLRKDRGVEIGMIWFRPDQSRQSYSKQILHADEEPFFVSGSSSLIVSIDEWKVVPAICYESLQPEHAQRAAEAGANLYLASVAKSARGIARAFAYYPKIAAEHHMVVLMANSVGWCDNFETHGSSAVWTTDGILAKQLPSDQDALLCYDMARRQSEVFFV
jgi:predicted amidohydrolase